MRSAVERATADHVAARHVIGIDRPGPHSARERLREATSHDQSMLSIMHDVGVAGHVATWKVDVGGRKIRTGADLKNPSTTVDAQLAGLQLYERM